MDCKQNNDISYKSLLGIVEAYDEVNFSILQKIIRIVDFIFFNYHVIIGTGEGNGKKVLFQRTISKRQDYTKIEDTFIKKVQKDFEIIELVLVRRVNLFFWKNIRLIWNVKKQMKNLDIEKNKSFRAYIQLVKCYKLKNIYNEILEQDIFAVVTFCDVHLYDNYLTQLANNKNISTYTFQHGVMHHNMKKYGDKTYLHFENSPAKNIFVWGKYFQKQYIENGFKSKENVIIVGNPKINSIVIDKLVTNQNKFIVILDREVGENKQYNEKIVAIANKISKEKGMDFDIRIHPLTSTDYSIYIEDREKNKINHESMDYKTIVEDYSFALVHMTSMYYELTCLDMRVFRFKSEYIMNVDYSDFDKISSYEEYLLKDKNYEINKPGNFSSYFISRFSDNYNPYVEALKNVE